MNEQTTGREISIHDLPEIQLPIDDAAAAAEALREKLLDAGTPGYQAEFDPVEAAEAGAFVETALTEVDAADSGIDSALFGPSQVLIYAPPRSGKSVGLTVSSADAGVVARAAANDTEV